jgi:hypothetical protein
VVGQSYAIFNKMLEDLSGDEVQALLDPKTRKSPKDLSYVEFKNQQWTYHAKKHKEKMTIATHN